MKIKINSVEVKTSAKGTAYKRVSISTEDGKSYSDVAVFSFYSHYNDVQAGLEVEGVVESKDYKGKPSYSLVDGNLGARPSSLPRNNIAKAQEIKRENIDHAQDKKELGIRLSSTARMATDMVVALMKPETTPAQAKVAWEQWRKWFIDQWENIGAVNVTSAGMPVPDFSGEEINPADIPF